MWDRAVFNEEHHCLELSYVGLNALMVADSVILARMAALLGREDERRELESRAEALRQNIDDNLWDDAAGSYMNRQWTGEFDPCMSLTHFYTIGAGIATGERLEKMLGRLCDDEQFGGAYMLPTVSRRDPAFNDQDYWRGRIWAPTNFLVGEGIMKVRRFDIWDKIIKNGLDMFVRCWDERGFVGENYNAVTGEAAETMKSDRFYHWGALLVYMAVNRVVNFNEWEDRTEYLDIPDWLGEVRNLPK